MGVALGLKPSFPLTGGCLDFIQSLLASKQLSGTLDGKGDKGSYVPHIYSKSQTLFVDQFFRSNGYIGALSRCRPLKNTALTCLPAFT